MYTQGAKNGINLLTIVFVVSLVYLAALLVVYLVWQALFHEAINLYRVTILIAGLYIVRGWLIALWKGLFQ